MRSVYYAASSLVVPMGKAQSGVCPTQLVIMPRKFYYATQILLCHAIQSEIFNSGKSTFPIILSVESHVGPQMMEGYFFNDEESWESNTDCLFCNNVLICS